MSFASDFTQFPEFRHISQHSTRNLCKMANLAIFFTRFTRYTCYLHRNREQFPFYGRYETSFCQCRGNGFPHRRHGHLLGMTALRAVRADRVVRPYKRLSGIPVRDVGDAVPYGWITHLPRRKMRTRRRDTWVPPYRCIPPPKKTTRRPVRGAGTPSSTLPPPAHLPDARIPPDPAPRPARWAKGRRR